MKIALTCPASLPATQFGGILFLCLDIAKELSSIGHDVTIYTTDLDFANNAKTFNKKLPRYEVLDKFKIKRSHVFFSLKLFYVNPEMFFQIRNDKPDIIHSIGIQSFQSIIAAIISKQKKIPLVISDQGGLTTHPTFKSSITKKILFKIHKPIIQFIINQASKISVGNEYEKKIFLDYCDENKIEIINNGINLQSLKPSSISFKKKFSIKDRYILFVGRFDKIKGIDILLQAIHLIKDTKEMTNTKLVIMGVDFGFESTMFSMISKLQINDVVIVIKKPLREDVIAAYQECEFLVLPSRWELSPLTPLEGFAFKKTVISTNAYGIPHTIENGKTGVLVESENYKILADAIIELLGNEAKRQQLGLAGYVLVTEKCNSKIMAEKTLRTYQKISNR